MAGTEQDPDGEESKPRKEFGGKSIGAIFTYHAPTKEQERDYEDLRENAKQFALLIFEVCPEGADRTAALRKLRECVMTANAAIALSTVEVPPSP